MAVHRALAVIALLVVAAVVVGAAVRIAAAVADVRAAIVLVLVAGLLGLAVSVTTRGRRERTTYW